MAETAASSSKEVATGVKVKKSQLEKAIKALIQLNTKRSANANPLFGASSETMNVIFNIGQVPEKRKMKPMLIELPHPMFDDKSEVCFFAKDPQKKYKEMLMKTHPVAGLTKVIGLEKLKKNYKTAESKRALADAFDLFLCDASVIEMMPKLLGTTFYEKKLKRPIPVRMRNLGDPAKNLQKAINGTTLRVPSGPCVGIKVGNCSMSEEHLVANAAAVITFASKYLSSNPVQTISVQVTDSPALPVWRRAAPPGELLDLKKHFSDAGSSSASDTGTGNASETEGSVHGSELPSDAGETFSTRASEMDSEVSELETTSEVETSDADALPEHIPLLKGLKGKRKKRLAAEAAQGETKAPETAMPPPKKAKKTK